MNINDLPNPVTPDFLTDQGFTRMDVRRRCPQALNRTGRRGRPCYRLEGLAPLFDGPEGGDEL